MKLPENYDNSDIKYVITKVIDTKTGRKEEVHCVFSRDTLMDTLEFCDDTVLGAYD